MLVIATIQKCTLKLRVLKKQLTDMEVPEPPDILPTHNIFRQHYPCGDATVVQSPGGASSHAAA
jgi:hypothetical protein